MNYKVLSTMAAAALVACGGGGGAGGGTAAPVGPSAVQITESNAKPVGAHATATAQDASAAQGSAILTGVDVQGGGSVAVDLPALTALVRRGAQQPAPVAAGVSFSQPCDGGTGSLTVSGSQASASALTAGDSKEIVASNCSVDGMVFNGSVSLRVVSGSLTDPNQPFHVVLSLVTTRLSVKTASQTTTTDGDLQLDWSVVSNSISSMTASGKSISSSLTNASGTRATALRNYAQTIAFNGAKVSGGMSASVESTSTVLGSGGGAYAISTPTDLVWTTTNSNPTAGVVKVVGANNSQLRVTYSANGAVLEVDADGDGNYEKAINTTAAELKGLL